MTEPAPKSLREQLLAQIEPARVPYERYQQETEAMLRDLEVRLRREKIGMTAYWLFAVFLTTSFLLLYGYFGGDGRIVAVATAFVILIAAAVEVVKHFINRSRVEILREIKSLELRILEETHSGQSRQHAGPSHS
jgi:hypothetical protein